VAAAVAFAHREAATYGGDPARLFVSGHSAGAYNAVMVASAPQFLRAEGVSPNIIAGVAGISGPYDFLPSDNPAVIALFAPTSDKEATQPVNLVSADTPPMLFIHGLKDTVVFRHNAENMKAALRDAGVRAEIIYYPEADHADTLIGIAWPRRTGTIADMIAFFESVD
ncbi:MAG: prolyl oligopeptidase family serine peptidase, partial [Pseudomonadota bacterium]